MEPSTQVPILKKDAQIPLTFGSEYVNRIQAALFFLLEDKDKEFSEALKVKLSANQELTAQEAAIVTLSNILQHIMKVAESMDLIEYRDISEVITPQM